MIQLEKAIKELGAINLSYNDEAELYNAFKKVETEFYKLKNADRSEMLRDELDRNKALMVPEKQIAPDIEPIEKLPLFTNGPISSKLNEIIERVNILSK